MGQAAEEREELRYQRGVAGQPVKSPYTPDKVCFRKIQKALLSESMQMSPGEAADHRLTHGRCRVAKKSLLSADDGCH